MMTTRVRETEYQNSTEKEKRGPPCSFISLVFKHSTLCVESGNAFYAEELVNLERFLFYNVGIFDQLIMIVSTDV